MKRILAAFLPMLLLGCTNLERSQRTDFVPLSETEFLYRAASMTGDPAAEARRATWLQEYLLESGMCADGYRILRHRPTAEDGGHIEYYGRCR